MRNEIQRQKWNKLIKEYQKTGILKDRELFTI